MTRRSAALPWIGLSTGAGVLALVVALFNRTISPALEIARYADDVAVAGEAIASNLEVADELARTGKLTETFGDLAGAYLASLEGER